MRSTDFPRSPWRRRTRSRWPRTSGRATSRTSSKVGYGGGAGCATVGHAAMAIATGQADVVVAWRSRKRGRTRLAAVGVDAHRACPSRLSGPARTGCSARWTRWPCWPGATCTNTGEAGAAGRGGHGDSGPRQPQSRGADVRQADVARRLHGGPVHFRAALPLRQLPGDRRRARRGARLGGAGPGLRPAAGAGARLRSGTAPPARGDGQLLLRGSADRPGVVVRPEVVVAVRVGPGRCGRGADLRCLHAADPALARGLRVLRAGRGRRLRRWREICVGGAGRCPPTRRVGACRRPTSTGST